ncbi:MAG: hypothetical protein KC731_22215 [Myxococcales bacterium]|nr:hypothetical protein [Myxococcales bacterium]
MKRRECTTITQILDVPIRDEETSDEMAEIDDALPFQSHALPVPRPPSAVRPPNPLAALGYGSEPPPVPVRELEVEEVPASPVEEPAPEPVVERLDAAAVGLEQWAELRAAVDLEPGLEAELLDRARLDGPTWMAVDQRWSQAHARALRRDDRSLVERADGAYVAALEHHRGPVDVATFAQIELAFERGDLARIVVRHGIPRAALIRLERVWARRTLSDRRLHRAVRETVRRLRDSGDA